MAVYDLEEQEQIDNLKAWWQQHGNLITWTVSALAVAVVAWQGWNWYQGQQAAQASALFGALQQAMVKEDTQRVRTIAGELTEKFGSTAYAPMGTLMAAKVSFESGDAKTARAQLAWVAAHGKDELRDVAHLRLAGVMLDEQAYDEALKELAHKPGPALVAAYAELKGDVLVAQGKQDEARAAYKEALEAQEKESKDGTGEAGRSPVSQLLHQKLDALGGAA